MGGGGVGGGACAVVRVDTFFFFFLNSFTKKLFLVFSFSLGRGPSRITAACGLPLSFFFWLAGPTYPPTYNNLAVRCVLFRNARKLVLYSY